MKEENNPNMANQPDFQVNRPFQTQEGPSTEIGPEDVAPTLLVSEGVTLTNTEFSDLDIIPIPHPSLKQARRSCA